MNGGKKTVFSAIQPTGNLTLGNYIGALHNFRPLQENNDCIFCAANLHSLTVKQVPAELREHTYNLIALYLACGVDPEKSIVFVQSHVSAHAELAWILDTIAYVGELGRMTQYKEKSKKYPDNVNMGLMNYPVLMASDILLYGTDLVPVGKDQTQHLELARDIAERFNNKYSPTFTVPEGLISRSFGKIMSLADPSAKMSKTDENVNATIFISDDDDTVRRKFRRAVTDCGEEVRYSADKPAVSNLLTIYAVTSGKTVHEAEKEFVGKGYGDFKNAVADSVNDVLCPIRANTKRLVADKGYLDSVMKRGAEQAAERANRILSKVYRKTGLVTPLC